MVEGRTNLGTASRPRSELERIAWPEIPPKIVERLREAGAERDVEAGDVLFEVGQAGYDLVYVERGSVRVVDRNGDRTVVTIQAPGFVGELGMLMGQGTFFAGVAAERGRVIVVPQAEVRGLVATVPEIGDAIVTAFATRRRRLLLEWNEGGLTIVGRESDPSAVRLLEFAGRNRIRTASSTAPTPRLWRI